MTILVDANILLRITDTTAAQHLIAVAAVAKLRSQGERLITCPQAIYEFWVVATRPVSNNGLGLTTPECDRAIRKLMLAFPVVNDLPTLFTEWQKLVLTYDCKGKPAHDARYVAAMNTHGITHLLTFNVTDFARYPDITVLDPNAVIASPLPPVP